MNAERILIVEDDPALLRGLTDNFLRHGFEVIAAQDGEKGLELAVSRKPDLVVLDIMLPKVNGFEVCRQLRQEELDFPIIMLTAKSDERDIVLGPNVGADDYVTKPFSIRELLARANALLRRRRKGKMQRLAFGAFVLDPAARTLSRAGVEVALAPKEFGVLLLLATHPARVYTRDELLRRIWGYDVFVTGRSVDKCVATLRAKIEDDPASPQWIRTVRSLGYRFEPGDE